MDLTNILHVFFSLENPVIYGIIIVLFLVITIILINKEYINPLAKRKSELELENTKLMALFAEVDPEPILRINSKGIITDINNAATEQFTDKKLVGEKISSLIPSLNNQNLVHDSNIELIKIGEKSYNISVKEVKSLGFKQIYLHDITKRVEYETQIKSYQESLRKLRAKFEFINEDEKQKLGQELHDGVGQNISLIKIQLQQLSVQEEQDISKINNLITSIDKLQEDIRDISHKLRPRILNEFGLIPAISSLIDSVNSKGDIKGFLSINGSELTISKEFELNIYRICQEAINNILKHSDCNNFYIQLFYNNEAVKLVISDDGKGFIVSDFSGGSSLGLLNIKERAATFNGTLSIDSTPNEGTSLFINFPTGHLIR